MDKIGKRTDADYLEEIQIKAKYFLVNQCVILMGENRTLVQLTPSETLTAIIFLRYIHNTQHYWGYGLGTPYRTSLWQLANG